MFEILFVNVAADVDVPAHDEYVRTCMLVSLTMIFVHVLGLSSALDIYMNTQYAHICNIEGVVQQRRR